MNGIIKKAVQEAAWGDAIIAASWLGKAVVSLWGISSRMYGCAKTATRYYADIRGSASGVSPQQLLRHRESVIPAYAVRLL